MHLSSGNQSRDLLASMADRIGIDPRSFSGTNYLNVLACKRYSFRQILCVGEIECCLLGLYHNLGTRYRGDSLLTCKRCKGYRQLL